MLSPKHIRDYIVRPVLRGMNMLTPEAEALVLCTGFQESGYKYLKQLGNGPALGLWQMEPATHDSLVANYIMYRPEIRAAIEGVAGVNRLHSTYLIGNLDYAAAFCRIQYKQVRERIPPATDGWALGGYWKKYYNTEKGKGTIQQWMRSWDRMQRVLKESDE